MKWMRLLAVLLLSYGIQAMDYYTFILDGKPSGYFEIEDKDGVIYSNAFIHMGNDKFENPFWVKYAGETITEFKFGDEKWRKLSDYPANSYPTAAFEILIRRIKDGADFTYDQITEGNNQITHGVIIKRVGNRYTEWVGGKSGRYIVTNPASKIIEYGWGGTAKSLLSESREQAMAGSGF
jgi:hypothetical protein